ncbi:hypothetical protein D1AOALGA4SA_4487 [Olavius algarvensis Delta 1 endosymbiont]|nr:hypothetical protein D1AOALGA4SA_4487 [Olavius algarvensis Delta 1 endosymbiont]
MNAVYLNSLLCGNYYRRVGCAHQIALNLPGDVGRSEEKR